MTHVGPSPFLSAGDVLADRYQLDQHINDDSAGRQVWRGVDIVLQRPVAIVLRHPGGTSAEEMLQAAVTASRVSHPHLIGVYDAIDQGTHAFVVREWIDGSALRDLVAEEGPFDPERTTHVLHAVTSAVAALHESGMAHGNIHPGTVLVAADGRVVVADARADSSTSPERDIRSVGACGYFMLTGHWPREVREAGRNALPDARRDDSGALVTPRKVRAGVPSYLDDLVMDLLSEELTPPSAPVLAAELSRLDTSDQLLFDGGGQLRLAPSYGEEPPSRSSTPKLVAVGGTALALVIAGMVLGIKALNANATNSSGTPGSTTPISASPTGANNPQPLKLDASQVRIVDPAGNRTETKNAALMVDGDIKTSWFTERYTRSKFGDSKPGMGILIKLSEPRRVNSVQVHLTAPGATAVLRTGTSDYPDTTEGDKAINQTYTDVGEPLVKHSGTVMGFSSDLTTQYLLVWITELPLDAATDKYRIGVQEITVEAQ